MPGAARAGLLVGMALLAIGAGVLTIGHARGPRPARATAPAGVDEPRNVALPRIRMLAAPGVGRAVAAVYTEDDGLFPRTVGPQVITAVWTDGRVAWSGDPLHGGPPYRAGRVRPDSVQALLDDWQRRGVFDDPALDRANVGPDAASTCITVLHGRRMLAMCSWHELYEAGGRTVATTAGLEPLDGRQRDAVLAAEPAAYQHYRRVWAALRADLATLIPDHGEPAGNIPFKLERITLMPAVRRAR